MACRDLTRRNASSAPITTARMSRSSSRARCLVALQVDSGISIVVLTPRCVRFMVCARTAEQPPCRWPRCERGRSDYRVCAEGHRAVKPAVFMGSSLEKQADRRLSRCCHSSRQQGDPRVRLTLSRRNGLGNRHSLTHAIAFQSGVVAPSAYHDVTWRSAQSRFRLYHRTRLTPVNPLAGDPFGRDKKEKAVR